jgi:large subunit ribosomal protein L21
MFAVIKSGARQYRVAAEDVITIGRIEGEVGSIVQIGNVLAYGSGDDVTLGAPLVDGASVAAEIIEHGRGEKVIAFKKRRRQNSRRKRGYRDLQTTVRISEILTGGAKPSKAAAAKKDDAAPKAKKAKAAKSDEATLFTAPEGDGDDLTVIKGIGKAAAGQLNEQGITTFAQIAALSDEDVAKIDANMPFSAEQISDWREQAKELAK